MPIGWTVSELALGHDEPCLVAEPRGHGGRDEEEDEPGVREQRGQLRVLVAVAVHVAPCRPTSASRTRKRWRRSAVPTALERHGRPSRPGRAASGRRTAPAGRPGCRRRRATVAASGRACRRRSSTSSTTSASAEPRRAEDREHARAARARRRRPRPSERVVAGVDVGHRVRVVGGASGRRSRAAGGSSSRSSRDRPGR